jgi:hypothetical protein
MLNPMRSSEEKASPQKRASGSTQTARTTVPETATPPGHHHGAEGKGVAGKREGQSGVDAATLQSLPRKLSLHQSLGRPFKKRPLQDGQVLFLQIRVNTVFREETWPLCILSTGMKVTISTDEPCSIYIHGRMREPNRYRSSPTVGTLKVLKATSSGFVCKTQELRDSCVTLGVLGFF